MFIVPLFCLHFLHTNSGQLQENQVRTRVVLALVKQTTGDCSQQLRSQYWKVSVSLVCEQCMQEDGEPPNGPCKFNGLLAGTLDISQALYCGASRLKSVQCSNQLHLTFVFSQALCEVQESSELWCSCENSNTVYGRVTHAKGSFVHTFVTPTAFNKATAFDVLGMSALWCFTYRQSEESPNTF